MHEDKAFEVIGNFLVSLEVHGWNAVLGKDAKTTEDLHTLRTALGCVKGSSFENKGILETLLRALFKAFEPFIEEYQRALLRGKSPRETAEHLSLLHQRFLAVEPLTLEWCTLLEEPNMVSVFPVCIRFKMLQHDLLSTEEPRAKVELLHFLRRHWKLALDRIEHTLDLRDAEREASDEVMRCLHGLTLSGTREVQTLLMESVVRRIQEKMAELDEDYSRSVLDEYMEWAERVLEPFLRTALPGKCSSSPQKLLAENISGCSAAIQQKLRLNFARKRLETFWNVLVDFPDSVPALEDLRSCVQRDTSGMLRQELLHAVRTLFAQRLHRAGARTEDIVEMLIKTVYSLFTVFSRSEQGVVFSTIGDTLAHIGKRKDCAAAVVQSINQLSEFHHPRVSAVQSRETEDSTVEMEMGGRDGPDFFRVLSAVIPVSELVKGYREMLASQLLSKEIHDFDTSSEDEVFERLKCSMGERILSDCMVMLRDMASSRRLTHRLANSSIRRSEESVCPPNVSLVVLSGVAWPEKLQVLRGSEMVPPPTAFQAHPQLQQEMERLGTAFHTAMPNQKLCWHLSLGRVKLHLPQLHPEKHNAVEPAPFTVSLFAASVLLFVQELSSASADGVAKIRVVAQQLGVDVKSLESYLPVLIPRMLVRQQDTLAVQTVFCVQSSSDFGAASVEVETATLTPEQVLLLKKTTIAILRSATTKSLHEIHNSLKQFASGPCTLTDLKLILKSLQEEGKVISLDAGYSFNRRPA